MSGLGAADVTVITDNSPLNDEQTVSAETQ